MLPELLDATREGDGSAGRARPGGGRAIRGRFDLGSADAGVEPFFIALMDPEQHDGLLRLLELLL